FSPRKIREEAMPTAASAINIKFLAALNGGVAAEAGIAQELGELFVRPLAKKKKIYFLTLIDKGDRSRVQGHETGAREGHICYLYIRKTDASLSHIPDVAPNWMAVEAPGLAKTFAMLVLRSVSQEGVNEQLPLSVSDQGDTWLVQGSLNR